MIAAGLPVLRSRCSSFSSSLACHGATRLWQIPVTITRIGTFATSGMYDFHTVGNGDVVVDGYVASTLTRAVHPEVSSAGLAFLASAHSAGLDVPAPLIRMCSSLSQTLLNPGPASVAALPAPARAY